MPVPIKSTILEAAITLTEAKTKSGQASKEIWYHGTSPKNLRGIMSQGLKASAQKNWDKDDNANRIQIDRTSYGGVYLTKNMMTAVSSATRGGYKERKEGDLLVIAQIQSRTLVSDEDSFARWMAEVPFEGFRWGARQALMLWFSMMNMDLPDEINIEDMSRSEYNAYTRKRDNRRFYNEAWEAYQKNFYKNYENFNTTKTTPQQKKTAEPYLKAAFHGAIERMAGYFPEEYGRWWKNDYHREYSIVDPDAKEEDLPAPPDPKEGEAKFRAAVDRITRIFKAPVTNKTRVMVVGRSLEDIGYSGANKILAILHIDRSPKTNLVTVHYGKIPDDFFSQWEERWGSNLYIQDKHGDRLPEYDRHSIVKQEMPEQVKEGRNALLEASLGKHIGWKIVASDGKGGAVSLYDKKVPVGIKIGSITKNTYLGNSPEYVNMFFRAASEPEDDQDILLQFEYDGGDLIKGDPDFKNGEVQVKKAKLISVHPLPRLFDDEDGEDIRRHLKESSDSELGKAWKTSLNESKKWEPGDKPYLNNPDLADLPSPRVNFRGPLPNDGSKAVVVMDGIQMTVPMKWLSDKPQNESVKPSVKSALVLVHVDSLDSYASQGGPWEELGHEWQYAMDNHDGPKIIVSQGWHKEDGAYSKEAMDLVGDLVGYADHAIEFDEDTDTWSSFIKQLDGLLKKLGVTNVVVGGIWYDPNGQDGCATEVIQQLRKLKYNVTPKDNLLGCEDDLEEGLGEASEPKTYGDKEIAYHVSNVPPDKLKGGKLGFQLSSGFTQLDVYPPDLKPNKPVFVSKSKDNLYDGKYIYTIDISGLKKFPDFPGFADYGAYLEEETMWWKRFPPGTPRHLKTWARERGMEMSYRGVSGEASWDLIGTCVLEGPIDSSRILNVDVAKKYLDISKPTDDRKKAQASVTDQGAPWSKRARRT